MSKKKSSKKNTKITPNRLGVSSDIKLNKKASNILKQQLSSEINEKNLKELETAVKIIDFYNQIGLLNVLLSEKLASKLNQAGIRNLTQVSKFITKLIVIVLIVSYLFYFLSITSLGYSQTEGVIMAIIGIFAGYFLALLDLSGQIKARQQEFSLYFSIFIDMLVICSEGGMNIDSGIKRIVKEIGSHSKVLEEELNLLQAELSFSSSRKQAFLNLYERMQTNTLKLFVWTINEAEQTGGSIADVLKIISGEIRRERFVKLEKEAGKIGPMLTVPMIVFFLPAYVYALSGPDLQVLSGLQ